MARVCIVLFYKADRAPILKFFNRQIWGILKRRVFDRLDRMWCQDLFFGAPGGVAFHRIPTSVFHQRFRHPAFNPLHRATFESACGWDCGPPGNNPCKCMDPAATSCTRWPLTEQGTGHVIPAADDPTLQEVRQPQQPAASELPREMRGVTGDP